MITTEKFQKVNMTRFLVYNQPMNKIEQQPYFTSDWHLFHKRIQQFCPFSRKGSTLEEMNEMIIQNVITTVPEGGDLWNLGDITFGKYDETKKLLRRIADHCNHHLILGNHDDESELGRLLTSCFTFRLNRGIRQDTDQHTYMVIVIRTINSQTPESLWMSVLIHVLQVI